MKELKTNNAGRMPLWQADLDWIQAGYTEPIEALVKELGIDKSYFAITGCVPYKPDIKTLAMDAGWFWWDGKILPVRALPATDVLSFTDPMVRLTKVTYSNPDGARYFVHADGTTEDISNVWQDDYLTPTVVERSAAFTSGVRLGIGAWTLRDIIRSHYAESETDWITVSGSGNSGITYKQVGRMVIIKNAILLPNTPYSGFPRHIAYPDPVVLQAGADTDHYVKLEDDTITYVSNGGSLFTIILSKMYMAATPYQADDHNFINDNPQS